ncbi:MAG: roadblock/LC7 domain-containing protein [Moraxellaceae bacterium]|uniref:roadblock/LC7 domain-containing protein n=1 Tax=Psychrobacter sp. TaxID=56811 RepID=UPI003F9CF08C
MTILNETSPAKAALSRHMRALSNANSEILLISLCSTDGFPIDTVSIIDLGDQNDKFAAMSSTLSALSDSSATQMKQGKCDITIVEATLGNILFVKVDYVGKPCVLTVVAKSQMALAEVRYKTKKLIGSISAIPA